MYGVVANMTIIDDFLFGQGDDKSAVVSGQANGPDQPFLSDLLSPVEYTRRRPTRIIAKNQTVVIRTKEILMKHYLKPNEHHIDYRMFK